MKQKTIKEIEDFLLHTKHLSKEEITRLRQDERKGVQALIDRWEKRQNDLIKQKEHFQMISQFENELYAKGYHYIAGVDEVGRGPLAGPVVASSVILKRESNLIGINDSKKLTESKREYFYNKIIDEAIAVGVGMASASEIDQLNIYQASKVAMERAIEGLPTTPDYLLLDAMKLSLALPQLSLVKGDAKSRSIAAGSIIAKVTRDRMMKELDQKYPGYSFSSHMGYPTKTHLKAIEELGPTPEHRLSFAPLKPIE